MASKQKPNYTKFMKKPASIQMSPERSPQGSRPLTGVAGVGRVRKDAHLPSEIIIEAEPVYDAEVFFQGEPLYSTRRQITEPSWNHDLPPLPILGIAVIVLIILSL